MSKTRRVAVETFRVGWFGPLPQCWKGRRSWTKFGPLQKVGDTLSVFPTLGERSKLWPTPIWQKGVPMPQTAGGSLQSWPAGHERKRELAKAIWPTVSFFGLDLAGKAWPALAIKMPAVGLEPRTFRIEVASGSKTLRNHFAADGHFWPCLVKAAPMFVLLRSGLDFGERLHVPYAIPPLLGVFRL